MKRILFVDDEPNVLEGLQRMLFPLQQEWEMAFAPSGAQALELMKTAHFDVIVSDMRMPAMDGAQLLAEVKARHPDTVRFILTGQSDSETVYRSVGEAHQFLTKPCKPKHLKETIDRALALRDLLKGTAVALQGLVSQIGTLPAMPKIYNMLCEELQSAEGSIAHVGQIIETDFSMTAKILQLVNSAFFGLRQEVSTASQAASLLGFDTLKALVLLTGLFSHIQDKELPGPMTRDMLWRHCVTSGAYAQAICQTEGASKTMCNDAYTAGLLHDTGMLVLATGCPADYLHAHDYAMLNEVELMEAERLLMGCTHAEVGAYLLGIWGLPNPIVEPVAYHHEPTLCGHGGFTALTAVHVANAIAMAKYADKFDYPSPHVNMEYLRTNDLESRLSAWEGACANVDDQEND